MASIWLRYARMIIFRYQGSDIYIYLYNPYTIVPKYLAEFKVLTSTGCLIWTIAYRGHPCVVPCTIHRQVYAVQCIGLWSGWVVLSSSGCVWLRDDRCSQPQVCVMLYLNNPGLPQLIHCDILSKWYYHRVWQDYAWNWCILMYWLAGCNALEI